MNREAHTDRVSSYCEFPAPVALQEHVLCLWTQSIVGAPGEHAHHVLPDGCIDIVFINHDAPIVVGPWTESFTTRFPPGTTVAGARFHPGRASGPLGLPASTLLNQSVPLRDIWCNAAHGQFARVADEPTLPARLAALEAALHGRLVHKVPLDPEVRAAIYWLARHPSGRVEQLSRWLGLSHRQLQRRFWTAVGYGPKMFQSVLRFQRLLHLASSTHEEHSLAHLAAAAGYADQAHMTREVGRYSGSPPARLLRSAACTLQMSNLFKTGAGSQAYP
jgi:AraC-like DNA-binding protein